MKMIRYGFAVMVFFCVNTTYAGVYCNQGEILSTSCGDIDMYGCCDGSAVIFCEPATGNLCKWDCENNVLTPGGSCYGKCGGYNQYPGGGFMCGCDPNCVALGDCCDDICNDCADIIPQCVDASGSTVCGWQSTKGWYDCMTVVVPGPPGYPMECNAISSGCTPNCAGKWCGPDGCGNACGSCASSQECDANGQCVMGCEPYCAGKNCGPDGCGGLCGVCNGDLICSNGVCSVSCTPNCFQSGSVCGPDGCGGSCGYCGSDMECMDGSCTPKTNPSNDMTDSVINSPTSDTVHGGNFVIDDCPPGQILKYGTCITPPPNDPYTSPSPPDTGGCHVNNKPISHWWLLLWIGIMAFYIFLRANKGDAND